MKSSYLPSLSLLAYWFLPVFLLYVALSIACVALEEWRAILDNPRATSLPSPYRHPTVTLAALQHTGQLHETRPVGVNLITLDAKIIQPYRSKKFPTRVLQVTTNSATKHVLVLMSQNTPTSNQNQISCICYFIEEMRLIICESHFFVVSLRQNQRLMGTYINLGKAGFQSARNSEYVDKSGLIAIVNKTLFTERRFSCVTRSRRFGKSLAAKMLCAYYDHSCDSRSLFADLEIAGNQSFEQHLNKYAVLYLDMTNFMSDQHDEDIVAKVRHKLKSEVIMAYPGISASDDDDLMDTLLKAHVATGDTFFFIIDEWDAICREYPSDSVAMDDYVRWLRRMFKSVNANDVFAGVYMTGILQVKKYNTQSALNNFKEYSMVEPGDMGAFFGFTKDEVRMLAEKAHDENTSILSYNNENSLACVLSIAYYYAKNDYIIYRELPTGKGFADLVFIPRKNVDLPAIIVELKVDKGADAAIDQIKRRQYPDKVKDYTGRLLLVGIVYDRQAKQHDCQIEKLC